MSNAAKAMIWQAEYQPWGAAQSLSGPLTLDLRFPGQWFQLEAGLHYNWHRHYDASLGRYTQPDPLGFVDGPSVFGYAGGSPYDNVDLDGRKIDKLLPLIKSGGAACYRFLFASGSGLLNANRYLRIGEGRKGGDVVFRAAGSFLEKLTGRKHVDFWTIRSLNRK